MLFDKPLRDYSSGLVLEPEVAGPEATLGEVFRETYNSIKLGGEAFSGGRALEQAYDRRLDDIFAATGQRRLNPSRIPYDEQMLLDGRPVDWAERDFETWLHELAAAHPDKRDIIAPDRPVRLEAYKLAQEAEGRAASSYDRAAPGVGRFLAWGAGGLAAGLTDPVNVAASALFAPARVGVGAAQIAWGGVKAAVANMAVEAGMQPAVQAWRKEAGLSHGLDEALIQIGFAGLIGGGLDVGVRAASRGVRGWRGDQPVLDNSGKVVDWQPPGVASDPVDALQRAADQAPDGSVLKRAANNDFDALREVAEKTGAISDPEVRGALQELDRARLFGPPPDIEEGEHLIRLADALRRAGDPNALPPGSAAPAPEPVRTWPELPSDAKPGQAADIDGKPVTFRAIDPRATSADADVVSRLSTVSGAQIAFEAADGRIILQRQAARQAEGEGEPGAYVFREADGWTIDDARMFAARKALEEQSGSPLDMAEILRRNPSLADRTLPLSDYKFRQALGLARLSPEAFDAVRVGRVKPGFASVVGHHVDDPSRHAGLIEDLARANIKNARAARAFIAQRLSGPAAPEAHAIRNGLDSHIREVLPERANVLAAAVKELTKDKRVFAVLEREAPRIRSAGNVLDERANVERQFLARKLTGLVETLANVPGRIDDLLQDAALEVASGVKIKDAANAFVRRVAEIMEAEGIRGLTARRMPAAGETVLMPEAMKDPFGPEAAAQSKRMELEAQARDARRGVSDAKVDDIMRSLEWVREMRNIPRPQRLAEFLRGIGGLRDDGGDVRNIMGGARARPGLISKKGVSLDDATLMAWEDGFLQGAERPEINELLDALSDDLAGRVVVRWQDKEVLADLEGVDELRNDLEKDGLANARTADDVRAILAERQAEGGGGQGEAQGGDGSQSAGDGAATAAQGQQRARDAAAELDDYIPFAIGSDQVRRGIDFQIRSGRTAHVRPEVTENMLAAANSLAPILPDGTSYGAVTRFEPLEKFKNKAGETDWMVRVWFNQPDGREVFFRMPWSVLSGIRAAFLPGKNFVAFLRSAAPDRGDSGLGGGVDGSAASGRAAGSGVRGAGGFDRLGTEAAVLRSYVSDVWHEFGHVRFRDLAEVDRTALVAHAEKLRVFDLSLQEFAALIRRPEIAGPRDTEPLRVDYTMRYWSIYNDREKITAKVQEEAVMHMVELLNSRFFTREDIAPVEVELRRLFGGRLPGEEVLPTNAVGASAAEQRQLDDGQPLFAIAGKRAKTADLKRLERAQALEAEGVDYFRIRLETGWERGADGEWRFELSDRDARLVGLANALAKGQTDTKIIRRRADQVIDNPLVFEAYPDLKRYTIELTYQRGKPSEEIDLDKRLIKVTAGSAADAVSKIVHAMQHAIQDKEAWAAGGSPMVMAELNRSAIADVDRRAAELVDQVRAASEDGVGSGELPALLDTLTKLQDERADLDAQSYVALYLRLAGEVEARNVETRLKFQRGQRIATSLRFTEDVDRTQQIVLRETPRRQLSTEDWEDGWFDELARRSAAYEKAEWDRNTRPVAPQKRSKDPIERAADDLRQAVAEFERGLWKAGDAAEEIAKKIERKFGFPVDAGQVARREVWWRIDELVQEARGRLLWTEDRVARLRELEGQGLRQEDIAARLSDEFRIRITPEAVRNQVFQKLGGRRAPRIRTWRWTDDMDRTLRKTVEAARNKASGLARTYSSVAKAMSDASGKTVTARDVEKRMYENGLSLLDRRDGKRGGGRPSEIWTPEAVALLTSKEVNGLSFSQMAALLSRRLEGEYTRNAVAGKLHQMKLGAKRAAAMAARRDADIEERADTGATIARHCKP